MNFETLMAFAGRHPILSLALVGLTVALIAHELLLLARGFKGLRPAELTALINHDNALVIDLRPAGDFEKGHVPGSKNVQMAQFDPENKKLAPARSLPVVVVCKDGQSSAAAAKRLQKAGFEKVHILDGGIESWKAADLPLIKGRA